MNSTALKSTPAAANGRMAELSFERCEPEAAEFWSVYGHDRTGGVLCFEDFPTQAQARAFADRLLEVWPHLNSRGLMT